MHLHRIVEISSEVNNFLSEAVEEKHHGLTERDKCIEFLVKCCLVWGSPETDPETRVQAQIV